jgi:hypothetical protein
MPAKILVCILTCLPLWLGATEHSVPAEPALPQLNLSQTLKEPGYGPITAAASKAPVRFELLVDFLCPGEAAAAELFISIADEALFSPLNSSPQAVVLSVPAQQLDGLREAARCEVAGPRLLTEQAQAFATLSCRATEGATSLTIRTPLNVWFDCPPAPE